MTTKSKCAYHAPTAAVVEMKGNLILCTSEPTTVQGTGGVTDYTVVNPLEW